MDSTSGRYVKADTCSLITNCHHQSKYLPDDIWVEIMSRLPIKSLFICGCVCKLWRNLFFAMSNKIDGDPLYVPACGLFIMSITDESTLTYLCLRTKKSFITQFDSPENNLICSSCFETGLLQDLSFDFSILYNLTNYGRNRRFQGFNLSGGLIVVYLKDGTSEVHNPATKKKYFVPKSPSMADYGGMECYTKWELPGFAISFPQHFSDQRFSFIVVRFCLLLRVMEIYSSLTRMWVKYPLTLDEKVMTMPARLRTAHHVARLECGVLCLYLLTGRDVGVAIKINCMGSMNLVTEQYCFPLPEIVLGSYFLNTELWLCDKSLYLSFYDVTGLWIWKAGLTQVDAWSWVPILEINRARQLCKPVAGKHLSKFVLDARYRVIPLASHPDVSVMYLLVESSVFAYDLKADTIDKIFVVQGDHESRYYGMIYKPLLRYIDAAEESCGVTDTGTMQGRSQGGCSSIPQNM